jgi:hypothetical protein
MPWTNKQKSLAVQACRAAGISEEQRVDVILRNFVNAHSAGVVTSTSPRLTNHDFESFMAIIERTAGGTILNYSPGFWDRAAADWLRRMRFKALAIAAALERAGKLAPDGVGLAGWIQKRVTGGIASRLDELEYHGLSALIIGLEAYARQNAVKIETHCQASQEAKL